jgi:hypothetical protein
VMSPQRVHLSRGDFLMLKVTRDGFERVLQSQDPLYLAKAQPEVQATSISLAQNQYRDTDHSLGMTLLLQQRDTPAHKQILLEPRSRRVWFEVTPRDSDLPIGLRWGPQPGYPAPAWSLSVAEWPLPAGTSKPAWPQVKVWWSWDNDDAGYVATLHRPPATDLETAFTDKEVPLAEGEDKAVIESVSIEKHDVMTQPGGTPEHDIFCLVVRLNYPRAPQGKPVWVEPEGLLTQGYEHRFYAKAGKYTGVFWRIKPEDAGRLTGLRIYSVDKLKQQCGGSELQLKGDLIPNGLPRPVSIPELLHTR